MPGQRRGTAIAMKVEERNTFLSTQPICRVATVGPGGRPHVSALWFVWDGTSIWLNSLTRSRRWTDLELDPRASIIVDEGDADFLGLRGVELEGNVRQVGEIPRNGAPNDTLITPERLFADKYIGKDGTFSYDGRHGWLQLVPENIVSWDFSKLRR